MITQKLIVLTAMVVLVAFSLTFLLLRIIFKEQRVEKGQSDECQDDEYFWRNL